MPSRNIAAAFSLLVLLLLIATQYGGIVRLAEAGKRGIHITDDLDDVVDDEKDEAWKEWGKKKQQQPEFDPPPDFTNMDAAHIQHEMMRRQSGPVFGFVKLTLGTPRTKETVGEIARRWTNVARTGGIELKEFLLSQPEAYEVKLGDQLFRRPGDPPFDEVYEKLRGKKNVADDIDASEDDKDQKDEL